MSVNICVHISALLCVQMCVHMYAHAYAVQRSSSRDLLDFVILRQGSHWTGNTNCLGYLGTKPLQSTCCHPPRWDYIYVNAFDLFFWLLHFLGDFNLLTFKALMNEKRLDAMFFFFFYLLCGCLRTINLISLIDAFIGLKLLLTGVNCSALLPNFLLNLSPGTI